MAKPSLRRRNPPPAVRKPLPLLGADWQKALDGLSEEAFRGARTAGDLVPLVALLDYQAREGSGAAPQWIVDYLVQRGWDALTAERVAWTWRVVLALEQLRDLRSRRGAAA